MLALISSAKRKSLERKASIQWESVLPDLQDTLQQARERWREAFTPLVSGVVTDAAEHWKTEAGIAFDVRNLEAEAWFIDYTLKFSDPICATSERQLAALLQQGQREGWSVAQMQKTMTQTFQQWMMGDVGSAAFAGARLPSWRTEAIARTETQRAYAAGSLEIYREGGVEQKEWLSSADERSRESHAEADGQVVGIDEAFDIGGESLMFPGDPSASPGTTINCRCSFLPVIADDQAQQIDTLDGTFDADTGEPGDTVESLNEFMNTSNGPLASALGDQNVGLLSVDYSGDVDAFTINRDVVASEAKAFVKESQNIQYGRDYLLQLARDHALENGVTVADDQLEALFNRQYAYRAEAILRLAEIDNIRLTEAQVRRLETAMRGDYLTMVYSREGSESGSLVNAATARGGQKLSGAALREARANFRDWVQGID